MTLPRSAKVARDSVKAAPDSAPKESAIEAQIRQYLSLKGIFFHKCKTLGVFDPTRRAFRKAGAEYRRGVSDLIGIYNGRYLAIEVKSAKGRLSKEQIAFQADVRRAGGIAFTARSVDDVQHALEHWRAYTHEVPA